MSELSQVMARKQQANPHLSKRNVINTKDLRSGDIALVISIQVAMTFRIDLNPKKVPKFDLYARKISKQLSTKDIVIITNVFNTVFELKHVAM